MMISQEQNDDQSTTTTKRQEKDYDEPVITNQRPPSSGGLNIKLKNDPTEISTDITTKELFLPAAGMFIFYVCHDALQEEMFRFPGFEFGWFMTLSEVSIMLLGGALTEGMLQIRWPPHGGRRTVILSVISGLCIAGSHGCGNTALRFSTYPLKVAFKSCKLVPTMAMGVCLTGRRYTMSEYFAALVMCAGLFMLTIADAHLGAGGEAGMQVAEVKPPKTQPDDVEEGGISLTYLGPMLLVISTSLDSIVPNLQERLLQRLGVPAIEMIFLSNVFMLVILVTYTFFSGELFAALAYCTSHIRVLLVLTLQSFCAYCGLRCYLTVIRRHGGVAAVLLGNGRKIITIILSFILFAKPCKTLHCIGLVFIFGGVYLGYLGFGAKRKWKKIEKRKTSDVSAGNGEISNSLALDNGSKHGKDMV